LEKIKVGITQRVDTTSEYGEHRDAVDQNLIKWVIDAGYIPVPIPNSLVALNSLKKSESQLEWWLNELNINVLLLSGGEDIGVVALRDLTESCLLKWAKRFNIPVLGLCRGMQMIGVWSGGRLVEIEGHVRTRHYLQSSGDQSFDWPGEVNSFHKKGFRQCPEFFNVLARSEDGVIEAFRHKKMAWEGWMWHPEREKLFTQNNIIRFKGLINNE